MNQCRCKNAQLFQKSVGRCAKVSGTANNFFLKKRTGGAQCPDALIEAIVVTRIIFLNCAIFISLVLYRRIRRLQAELPLNSFPIVAPDSYRFQTLLASMLFSRTNLSSDAKWVVWMSLLHAANITASCTVWHVNICSPESRL